MLECLFTHQYGFYRFGPSTLTVKVRVKKPDGTIPTMTFSFLMSGDKIVIPCGYPPTELGAEEFIRAQLEMWFGDEKSKEGK